MDINAGPHLHKHEGRSAIRMGVDGRLARNRARANPALWGSRPLNRDRLHASRATRHVTRQCATPAALLSRQKRQADETSACSSSKLNGPQGRRRRHALTPTMASPAAANAYAAGSGAGDASVVITPA